MEIDEGDDNEDMVRSRQSNRSNTNNSNAHHDHILDQNQSQISEGTMSLGASLNKMNELLLSGVTSKVKNNPHIDLSSTPLNLNEDISMAIFAINNIENPSNIEHAIENENINDVNDNDINFGLDNESHNNQNTNMHIGDINNLRMINNMNLND